MREYNRKNKKARKILLSKSVHNLSESTLKVLSIKFFCLNNHSFRIIIFPLPYLAMKYEESFLKALVRFFMEKSPRHTINIGFEESSLSESKNWHSCCHCFEGSYSCILFLWHEKSSGIHIDSRHFFVRYSSEKFDIFSGDFLEFFSLCTVTDDFEIDSELIHHSDNSIHFLEWCESTREDIIISLRKMYWAN